MVTRHADKDAHLRVDNLLLLPSGPLPSHFSQTRVELEGMHRMVQGGELGVVSLLQDSFELLLALKPTCCGVF